MSRLKTIARRLRNRGAALLPATVMVQHGSRRSKRLAMTFDDGPDEMTTEYLTLLGQLEVASTFFVTGQNCAKFPELVREIAEHGHQLAGHGYTHTRFPELGTRALLRELRETQRLLPTPNGRPLVRPPHGALSTRSLAVVAGAGFVTAMWSHDSEDWRVHDAAGLQAQNRPEDLAGGDVVLLHEGQRWTLDALPGIVEQLRSSGFEFVTMSAIH